MTQEKKAGESQGITCMIHSLGAMNVCIKFHGNTPNIVIPRATSLSKMFVDNEVAHTQHSTEYLRVNGTSFCIADMFYGIPSSKTALICAQLHLIL